MKSDLYGAHAVWMHIHYLIKVLQLVCEINITYC